MGNCDWRAEVGTRNFFLSPQSQFSKLKEELPQLLKKFCSATATPQFCYRNFSEVRNFKSATWELHFRNFRHIFGCGVAWICHLEDFKGTVARDFQPLFFFVNQPHSNPWVILKKIFVFGFKSQYPKFRVGIRNPYGVDSWNKKIEAKNLVFG